MLSYVLFKPEATHFLDKVGSIVSRLQDEGKNTTLPLKEMSEGIRILKGERIGDVSKYLLHVETGVMTEELLNSLYPSLEISKKMIARAVLLDKPYSLMIINSESSSLEELQDLKGKMPSSSGEGGFGLRKKLREEYGLHGETSSMDVQSEDLLLAGQNFIHIPDNSQEVELLVSFIKQSKSRDGRIILLDRLSRSNTEGHMGRGIEQV